jgi:hypothetical protein
LATENSPPGLNGRAKNVQPLDVPDHDHKASLAADSIEAVQQKLPDINGPHTGVVISSREWGLRFGRPGLAWEPDRAG